MKWFILAFTRFLDFKGRSRRREYGWFMLTWFVALIALVALDAAIGAVTGFDVGALSTLFVLASIVPHYAVSIRRLHDLDASGWWVLLGFVPVASLGLVIVLLFVRGTVGDNRWGADPVDDAPVLIPAAG